MTQKGFECECRIRSVRTGEFRWHLLRVVPEFNESELVGWIGVITDIQDQKAVQQELLLSKTLADEIGAKSMVLNPIEGLTKEESDQGENYVTIMYENIKSLQTALQCS